MLGRTLESYMFDLMIECGFVAIALNLWAVSSWTTGGSER